MLLGYHYMDFYHMAYAVNEWLASQGYIVMSVNYRSGIGYGKSFRTAANTGGRGNAEYRDVIAAGKYLQTRADVDPARVGIWGLSYGGVLTAQALARNSDVFAAGVDMAGVHLWGSSLDSNDVSYKASAISAIDGWKSPVLIWHNDDDRNVDFSQTIGLVDLLRARNVYFELIVNPDDTHETLLAPSLARAVRADGHVPRPVPSQPQRVEPLAVPVDAIDIRPLRTNDECYAAAALQREVWGQDYIDVVPATLLHVVDYVGGLAAGAFDASGDLRGFVFGINGVRDGEIVHWSHMLGVRESARNLGLGRRLKEFQCDTLRGDWRQTDLLDVRSVDGEERVFQSGPARRRSRGVRPGHVRHDDEPVASGHGDGPPDREPPDGARSIGSPAANARHRDAGADRVSAARRRRPAGG